MRVPRQNPPSKYLFAEQAEAMRYNFNIVKPLAEVELNFDLPRMALLHFRFFSHLVPKLARLREGRATPGAVLAYDQVAARLKAEPAFSFAYGGSVAFRSPAQLVERGLISL